MKKLIGLAVLLAAFGMSAGIAGAQQTASQPLTLTVAAKLTITTTTLPAAVINTAYSASISYIGGTGPYSCTITSGALPAGLALGTATATSCPLSGTPHERNAQIDRYRGGLPSPSETLPSSWFQISANP